MPLADHRTPDHERLVRRMIDWCAANGYTVTAADHAGYLPPAEYNGHAPDVVATMGAVIFLGEAQPDPGIDTRRIMALVNWEPPAGQLREVHVAYSASASPERAEILSRALLARSGVFLHTF